MKWNLELLMSLEWKRFEDVCTEYLILTGNDARLTQTGADGGIDIQIYQENTIIALAQCKAWGNKIVGVKEIRELNGVMASENVNKGIFFTTSSFSQDAIDFSKKNNIELFNGNNLIQKIKYLPSSSQERLIKLATAEDYTTPTCPNCNIKLTLRTAKNSGQKFWGCINYPKCKYTLKTRKIREEKDYFNTTPKPLNIKTLFAIVIIAFLILKIFENKTKESQEFAKKSQEKTIASIQKIQREAKEREKQKLQQKAKLEAQIQAAEEAEKQNRRQKLKQAREKIAQERAEEKKAADFEAQYQAPEGCDNPDAEWSKFVECKNHKITAKENFYKTH